ncbi:MAG TPA: hypothetical protein VEX13_16315 [Chloroflexia bacterium]|nr:hypothetical protein [Chloroflexia bacterium]
MLHLNSSLFADTISQSDLAVHSFDLLGRRIVFATNMHEHLHDFLRSFEHWRVEGGSASDIYVYALHLDEWPAPLRPYRLDEDAFWGQFGLFDADMNSYYRLNVKSRELGVEALFHAFEWAAHKMTLEAGCRMMHAAGLAYKGQGIALVGDAGSGKSTLSTTLMQEPQWSILSDDKLIFVPNNERDVNIHSYSRRVRIGAAYQDIGGDVLWDSNQVGHPASSSIEAWVDGRARKSAVLVPLGKFVTKSPLRLIMFTSVHPLVETPRIKRLSPDEAHRLLLLNELSISGRLPTSDQAILNASDIPAYIVLMGLDVTQNAEQIARLAASVLA